MPDQRQDPPVSPAVEEPDEIPEDVIHAAYDAADATLETSAQGRWLRPAIEAALNAAWPFLKLSPAVEEPERGTIEHCARALHQRDVDDPACEPDRREWDCLSVALQDQYRADVRVVLAALAGSPSQETK